MKNGMATTMPARTSVSSNAALVVATNLFFMDNSLSAFRWRALWLANPAFE